jgi:hypothetical protein
MLHQSAYSTLRAVAVLRASAFLRELRVKTHCAMEAGCVAVARRVLYGDERDSSTRSARSE